jgi:hypothetical protein
MPEILSRLASALDRNDERPNVELAEELAKSGDAGAIADLAGALTTGSVAVQNDAIKVLYEIGALQPALVAPHAGAFLKLLGSKNNRNVWGALQAVESITSEAPAEVAKHIPAVLAAADKGSVIAKDKAVGILARLAAKGHDTQGLLLGRLEDAAPNQFPMYAEIAAPVMGGAHKARFKAIVEKRLPEVDGAAKIARLEKLLRKLTR